MENGYIESFNGKLREECLNQNGFESIEEARRKIEQWRVEYNEYRPHSALGQETPSAFEQQWQRSRGRREAFFNLVNSPITGSRSKAARTLIMIAP